MSEIKKIGDRVTVLRDGRKIATVQSSEVSEIELVELITRTQDRAVVPAHRAPPDQQGA